jgi:hypothetical protein
MSEPSDEELLAVAIEAGREGKMAVARADALELALYWRTLVGGEVPEHVAADLVLQRAAGVIWQDDDD